MRVLRAALTETKNAFAGMPGRVEDLAALAPRLDEVRRANVDHNLELIAEAAARGAQVVGLGELFPSPYFALGREPMWRAMAEDAERGPTVSAVREAARRHVLVVVAPIYELDADGGGRFNTAVVVDADGSVLGKYRKTHVPSGKNEQGAFDETFYYAPSDGRQNAGAPRVLGDNPFFPVFDTAVGRIGIATCYDRHFEGVVRSLALAGAELCLSPAVTFGQKSRRLWELEFQVDAARHRVYIGGSNRRGAEPPWNQDYFGQSYFAGPDGRLDDRSDHDGLVIADLDLDALKAPDPSGWDLARDARPEIYSPRQE